ncbi:penicillin acylase family protein [Streptomyces sp. MAR4 CNX-425]|uniref:penicillin acylase family protein n=1 Tax=Streptomyces sp. MAR4 CNX-425 TaxID=3406343 RepID=UPI003B50EC93
MPVNENGRTAGKRRRLIFVAIGLAAALVLGLGAATFWTVSTVRDSFPQTTGSLKLPGLGSPVTVKRDARGVPTLYGDTAEDLFRAQGFVHAQDRFWEMDVRRHMTSGRLSEMFGADQVETDEFLRTLGWRQVAQEEYEKKLSADTKKYLRAYADGVNAYLADHSGSALSVEYAALGFVNDYEPEKWTPVDSVAWLKAMAWDLRANVEDEIDRSLLSQRFDEGQIADLYPPYPYKRNKPIVEGGSAARDGYDPEGARNTYGAAVQGLSSQMGALAQTMDEVPALLGPSGSGIGSNSWVVSGDLTTTGKPLLANDPHLAAQLPSVWYQMGLQCKRVSEECPYEVSGFSFSGMPGVVIGHNADISWGMTNLGADVADLYLEKVEDDGYLYDGESREFGTREELIKVADGEDKRITVRTTRNGPVISDRSDELAEVGKEAPVGNSAPDRGDGYAVSLRWTALEPSRTMDAVFGINAASDFEEFRDAARDFAVPSQNLVYADTEGNIGYQAPGKIPRRGTGDGSLPAPGWDPAYSWDGYIPFDALPWELNPARGYVVTANQAVVNEKEYPYLLTTDPGYGTRSQRIADLIESKIKDGGKISPDDMRTMQLDNHSEIAELLTPLLLKIELDDPMVREAQGLLKDWDYSQDTDSSAAAYFNGVYRNILKLAFGDKMPKELRPEGECLRVPPANPAADPDGPATVRECGKRDADAAQPDGGDRWFEVVRSILKDEDNRWWKTTDRKGKPLDENRDDLLEHAMVDARWELTAELGKDIDTWSWGRLHQLMLRNQTLGTDGPGVVQWLLNRGPWNLSGGEAAVNATGWNAAGGYDVLWVPSMRMVVDMADFDGSGWVNLSGASGHAFHPNYTDQTTAWAKGELYEWPFSDKAVEEATGDTMTLSP